MKSVSTLVAALLALPLAACVITDGDDDDTAGTATGTATEATDATATVSATDPTADTSATDPSADTSATDPTADTSATDPTAGGGVCEHTCAGDGDCTASGVDIGLICTDSHCVLANPCETADDCVATLSGWSFLPCTMGGGECAAAMQICVDLGDGTGGCATPPSEFVMCDLFGQQETEQTNLDDGSTVTVCGQTAGECNEGVCTLPVAPCVDDTTCGNLVCNVGTGLCECDGDDDCGEGGTCTDGACSVPGCVDDTDCTNPFDGGTIACN
ncbi:MAG: hypothetical protein JNK45_16710 [Myxococcales bacterium]|nr:hypothetical protein [Myxococcales bacterium]